MQGNAERRKIGASVAVPQVDGNIFTQATVSSTVNRLPTIKLTRPLTDKDHTKFELAELSEKAVSLARYIERGNATPDVSIDIDDGRHSKTFRGILSAVTGVGHISQQSGRSNLTLTSVGRDVLINRINTQVYYQNALKNYKQRKPQSEDPFLSTYDGLPSGPLTHQLRDLLRHIHKESTFEEKNVFDEVLKAKAEHNALYFPAFEGLMDRSSEHTNFDWLGNFTTNAALANALAAMLRSGMDLLRITLQQFTPGFALFYTADGSDASMLRSARLMSGDATRDLDGTELSDLVFSFGLSGNTQVGQVLAYLDAGPGGYLQSNKGGAGRMLAMSNYAAHPEEPIEGKRTVVMQAPFWAQLAGKNVEPVAGKSLSDNDLTAEDAARASIRRSRRKNEQFGEELKNDVLRRWCEFVLFDLQYRPSGCRFRMPLNVDVSAGEVIKIPSVGTGFVNAVTHEISLTNDGGESRTDVIVTHLRPD